MADLQLGKHVWIKDTVERGTVVSSADTPRSYIVETPGGTLRRNRFHLSPTPVAPEIAINLPYMSTEPNTLVDTTRTPVSPKPQDQQQQPQYQTAERQREKCPKSPKGLCMYLKMRYRELSG